MLRKYNFSQSTLNQYELNIKNPSDQKINELLDIFKNENVIVSLQWLKNGIGETPKEFKNTDLITQNMLTINNIPLIDSLQLIDIEKQLILKLYPNAITGVCDNFELEPTVKFSDEVAGIPCDLNKIRNLEDVLCLVKYKNKIYIKVVNKINEDNTINLIGINPKKASASFYLSNVTPDVIAPVIWIRKNPDDYI